MRSTLATVMSACVTREKNKESDIERLKKMGSLNFKISTNPKQNIRWSLWHAVFCAVFVFLLNQCATLPSTTPVVKAVLIVGALVNLLYFFGYVLIAGVRFLSGRRASQKNKT